MLPSTFPSNSLHIAFATGLPHVVPHHEKQTPSLTSSQISHLILLTVYRTTLQVCIWAGTTASAPSYLASTSTIQSDTSLHGIAALSLRFLCLSFLHLRTRQFTKTRSKSASSHLPFPLHLRRTKPLPLPASTHLRFRYVCQLSQAQLHGAVVLASNSASAPLDLSLTHTTMMLTGIWFLHV